MTVMGAVDYVDELKVQLAELELKKRPNFIDEIRMKNLRRLIKRAGMKEVEKSAGEIAGEGDGLSEWKVRIYAVPRNKFCRLVEFDDGERGVMWCKPTERLRENWLCWVRDEGDGRLVFVREAK